MKEVITSESNKIVRLAKKLRDRRGRDSEGAFLAEGEHLLEEARKSGARIMYVLLRESGSVRLRERVSDWGCGQANGRDAHVPGEADEVQEARTVVLADGLFDRLADTVTPQAVMTIVRKPCGNHRFGTEDTAEVPTDGVADRAALVVLDRLRDPGNVGGIIRSAEAAGFTGVIAEKGSVDIFSQKVVRAASGALFRIPVRFVPDAAAALRALKSRGIRTIACSMAGERTYDEAPLAGDVAIIVGNEGGGLSAPFLTEADERIRIPMREGSESLNVLVAASIVMFEKRRQERKKREEPC
ncbi:MAG: RNA methyltransferase [Clostridiales Family XIII bacterium]|jgi:TrmH family RNA methyltransferase|nr:RNA methyltransferase [Clostridiales Family XIII bacterium]